MLKQLSLGAVIMGDSVFFHHLLNLFLMYQVTNQVFKVSLIMVQRKKKKEEKGNSAMVRKKARKKTHQN